MPGQEARSLAYLEAITAEKMKKGLEEQALLENARLLAEKQMQMPPQPTEPETEEIPTKLAKPKK